MHFTIVVTEDCNLRCSYCYEGNNKKKNYMNFDTANNVLQFISNESKKYIGDKHPLVITFHGGEPLLNFDIIKYLHKSLNESIKDKKIVYDMTSNGTILTDEMQLFIKENMNSFSISIDGVKESHDMNRVFNNGLGSYELVIKNARKLLDEGVELRARMTFNKYNIKKIFESVVTISELGFKYIVPAMDFYTDWENEELEILKEQVDKIIEFKKNNKDLNISITDLPILHKKKGDCFGGECSFCIGSDGIIYPCTLAIGKKEFVIGDVNKEKNCLNIKVIKELEKINFSKLEGCSKCTRYEYCTGPRCKILNKLVTGDYNSPPYITCFEEHLKVRSIKELKSFY